MERELEAEIERKKEQAKKQAEEIDGDLDGAFLFNGHLGLAEDLEDHLPDTSVPEESEVIVDKIPELDIPDESDDPDIDQIPEEEP